MKPRKILGESPAVKDLLKFIARVAPSQSNVLIIGESGTGKELVARMLHESGPLNGKPFIPVNCGAIPETLIESEMFGHKRGSFTGAISDKQGLFEAANGGTLFLDEVGELPLSMQVKLLRALQERVIRKVGGNDDVRVDARIVAATNRDLAAAVAKGTFREDLFYRLNVILITTPPLRERKGDVGLLARSFLKRFTEKFSRELDGFESDALAAIENYPWPGNVRELENVIERAVTLESGVRVSLSALPDAVARAGVISSQKPAASGQSSASSSRVVLEVAAPDFAGGPVSLDSVLGEIERMYLMKAIEHSGGVKKKAAELLGITFRSIRYRLSKLGMADDGGE